MARTVEVKVISDSDGRGFKSAAADAERFGSRLRGSVAGGLKIAALAAIPAAAAIGVFTVKSIDAAGDLGEQINKTGVVFGNSAKEVHAWGETAAESIGLSNRAALEAAGTFGNMLVPMGLARGKAADMSTSMVTLAGDLASFNNADPTQVLEAMGSALAGETEPLRQFGVFLNQARIEQEAMNLGLYNGEGAISATAKAQAIYALILKDTKDAQGDFGRTSDGLANSQRILKARFEDITAEIGQRLLPVAEDFMGFLKDVADSSSVGEALGKIGEGIAGIVRSIADFLGGQDWGHIGAVVGEKVAAVIEAVPWGSIVKGAGKLLWGALSTAFSTGVDLLNDAGVGQTIRDYFERMFEDAMDFVVPAADALMGVVSGFLSGLAHIPGLGEFGEWADEIDEAREELRGWNDALDEAVIRIQDVGDGFVSFQKVAQHAFDVDGIEGLATHLAAIDSPINEATLATIAWTQAFGEVPEITQVNAVLEDDAALAAIQAYIARIGDIPEDHKSRAELLAQAAIDLANELKAAIERVPDDHKTQVTAPGAKDAEKDVDAVDRAVRNMKDSKTARINVTGDGYVIDRLNTVNALAGDVTKTVTTYYRDVELPQGTAAAAGGMTNWRGGMLLVGERGPELVSLPRGSDVYTASETRGMLGSPGSPGSPLGRGGGGDVIHIHIPGYLGNRQELMEAIKAGLRQDKQRNGEAVGV